MLSIVLLPFFLSLVIAQCPTGCKYCSSAGKCSECKDWFHLDTVNNVCKVGEVIETYTGTGPYTYQGVVNGHPRHEIPVQGKLMYDPAGLVTDMLFIKNRNTGATKPIYGVNHWYWTVSGDSSLYMWPQLGADNKPIDYSNIFTPATAAPVDIYDVREVPQYKFRGKYNSTGPLVFEGVVNGYPRVKVPVNFLAGPKGTDGDFGLDFFLFNRKTGDSYPIFGVNHWLHTDGFLYFWSAALPAGVNQAALNALLPKDSTFWIMQMKDKCGTGCVKCTSMTQCTKCRDGLYIDETGACRVGKVIDTYTTLAAPVYEGVVNGYPRHRVKVDRNYPTLRTVQNARGMTGDQLYLRNRVSGWTQKIWGINHFWWLPDSSLYVWPVQNLKAGLGDWSKIYSPATAGPVDIVDFASLHPQKKRAQYVSTGAMVYEGVVNGYPRFKVPVKNLYRNSYTNDAMVSTALYLLNQDTGRSEVIFGVNHWFQSSGHFYFWPTKTELGLTHTVFTNLIPSGTTFWVVQYGDVCPIVGCKECSTATTCGECADDFYLDTKSGLCKVGVTLKRYTAVAAPVNEGVVNGFLRYRVRVDGNKIVATHGLISDMAYVRNAGTAVSKKIYGVNHYFWSTSKLYTWPVDTVAGVDPAGSWTAVYGKAGSSFQIYDVAALDPVRFRAQYRSTGPIVYEGVVNGYPRYRVPIKLLGGDRATFKDTQTDLDFYIFNVDTGDSRPMWGVNHWYWTSTHLYFWPTNNATTVKQSMWVALMPTGTNFWVMQMKDVSCGDGKKEGLEECDDANLTDGDGCSRTCIREVGYTCPTAGKPCVGICGDSLLVKGEACEDGNTKNNDGCSSTCTIEKGWVCPDKRTCTTVCGDGLLRGKEACDDKNTVSGDGCSAKCDNVEDNYSCPTPGSPCVRARVICGNSLLEPDERCDDGNKIGGDGCNQSCLKEDGWDCPTLGKPCVTICGDGKRLGSEACDDGNTKSGDGCSDKCVVESGWKCGTAGTACTSICGDSIKTSVEGCDDGNTKNFDGCSSACKVEKGWTCPTPGKPCTAAKCGDVIIAGAERCEDGNAVSGDGCSSTCQKEAGWVCTVIGKPCTTVCGDGMKLGNETCDDGNTAAGDGCSSTCTVEEGYTCAPINSTVTTSKCSAICGDMKIRGKEVCDDGNAVSGDGCSSTCQAEAGWECFTNYPGKCCKIVSGMLSGFSCNNGSWVPKAGATSLALSQEYELTDIQELSICGYITVNASLTLKNTNLHIAGSLTILDNTELRLIESTVRITKHCAATESSSYVRFALRSGANVTVEGMDWPDAEESNYSDPRISIDDCADIGLGGFYLEAENIPSGSNPLPFLYSSSKCFNNKGEDDAIFEEMWHEIPGSCSGIDAEKNEDGNVDVIINMKHLCPGAIAGIVIGSIVGAMLLLAVAFFALGGGLGGGASSEDYMAL